MRMIVVGIVALVALASMQTVRVVRAQGTVNLTLEGWSSSDAENRLLQQIVDTFNKANTGKISVKLNQVPDYDTTLAKDLASGNPPDVFYVDEFRLKDLVQAKALAPIGDKMTNVDDFYPSLKDAFNGSANSVRSVLPIVSVRRERRHRRGNLYGLEGNAGRQRRGFFRASAAAFS